MRCAKSFACKKVPDQPATDIRKVISRDRSLTGSLRSVPHDFSSDKCGGHFDITDLYGIDRKDIVAEQNQIRQFPGRDRALDRFLARRAEPMVYASTASAIVSFCSGNQPLGFLPSSVARVTAAYKPNIGLSGATFQSVPKASRTP